MINTEVLVTDLASLVWTLEADLRPVEGRDLHDALRTRYGYEHEHHLTRSAWAVWRDGQLTHAAVAWVLGTVFVRFCEDNGLLDIPCQLASPATTSAHVQTGHDLGAGPTETALDHLRSCFDEVTRTPLGSRLFEGVHHPESLLPISADAARALVAFWNRRDDEGRLVHDFTDPDLGTGFLADLYENLSESVRKEHALIRTPDFVVDLILDLTLTPAVAEFGHEAIKMIDPVCGSGQFVLSAFDRLLRVWETENPLLPAEERVRRAMAAVHGIDLTPSSVAITRFRLLVTALRAAGTATLIGSSDLDWPLNITIGDSLLGSGSLSSAGEFHIVAGNPPYLMVRDPDLSNRYRKLYDTCQGRFALTVPFIQRFFQLARPADSDGQGAGHVGLLAANSFMKREFGRKLATFLAERISLTHILDTSGAYIPGHGTPTLILVGRSRLPIEGEPVFLMVGKRSEPSTPVDPRAGVVWQSIRRNVLSPGLADHWTQSFHLDRQRLRTFPWSLSGGATSEMLDRISGPRKLGDIASRIGYTAITGSDDVFVAPMEVFRRLGPAVDETLVEIATGFEVRDWAVQTGQAGFFPRRGGSPTGEIARYPPILHRLWPYRTILRSRHHFSDTYRDGDRAWYDWSQVAERAGSGGVAICFPWVASHNHFALQRGRTVSLQSAPVIELPETATQVQYVSLLGLLNTSAVCFWLKQRCHSKGSGIQQEDGSEAWQQYYEFTGTQLRDLPVPTEFHTWQAGVLDGLAQERLACSPEAVISSGPPTDERLATARRRWEAIGREMIAIQEELDWEIYARYGLLPDAFDDLVTPVDSVPQIKLGERAFEIVLAKRMAVNQEDTTWFTRHDSTPITTIPENWPATYRDVVARRIEAIERHDDLAVLERPEFKRRWHSEYWVSLQVKALRRWLLNRCESRDLWFEERNGSMHPRPLTAHRLAELLYRDPNIAAAAALYAPGNNPVDLVADLVADEHVPCLAAMRYTSAGLTKRADWERVWNFQRAEDAAPTVTEKAAIRAGTPLPPKYSPGDFRRPSFWRIRGKSDVPNERFISYPSPDRSSPGELLVGWAGWDYQERAQVLADLVTSSVSEKDGNSALMVPLLAALCEILPWLTQWHDGPAPARESASNLTFDEFVGEALKRTENGVDALQEWRPQPPRRGRPRKEVRS